MAGGLSERKLNAIALLVQGRKCKDVAEELNVSPQTISEWKTEPEFGVTLNKMKWEIVHSTIDRIRIAGEQAASALLEIALHSENDETRRKACINILELTGLATPQDGAVGMGIGSIDPESYRQESATRATMSDIQFNTALKATLATLKKQAEEVDDYE